MPRYFFNIRSGGDYVADDEGNDCPTLQAAGNRAVNGARELMADLDALRRMPEVTSFEITDESGRVALRIPFTVALRPGPDSKRLAR